MKSRLHSSSRQQGAFTLLELMIVIMIIGVLSALAFPVFSKLKRAADETLTVNNLKQLGSATLLWAADHGDKLPSPRYEGTEDNLPVYWTLETDGEQGLWLNGVVFAQIYIEDQRSTGPDDIVPAPSGGSAAEAGSHLVGTVFESRVSTLRNPDEKDWYKHSFAMNANLEYDELAKLRGLSDPYLSEKSVSKFEPAAALLYIDCSASNIVMASDLEMIMDAAEERYEGRRVIAAYMDGRVQKIDPDEIPTADPENDRESSMFWRGVMPKR